MGEAPLTYQEKSAQLSQHVPPPGVLAALQQGPVTTDSRNVTPGAVFVALRGPHFNGNEYAGQALAAGARLAVVDDPTCVPPADDRFCLVPQALLALQAAAQAHRRTLGCPIMGLTGSNGKTTTKELLALTLAPRGPVWVTPGNRNNAIGLPLTLLQARPEHCTVVLEMGDNQPGDIAELCAIAEPTHGFITNVGLDHLGGYPSQEANVATKLELYDYLRATRGVAWVPVAEPELAAYAQVHGHWPTLRVGGDDDVQLSLVAHRLQGLVVALQVPGQPPITIETQLYGRYNLPNLLAAAAIAHHLGVAPAQVAQALAAYRPTNNRSQVIERAGYHLLLDAYNANPSSLEPALADLGALQGTRAAVLGDMLELGPASRHWHLQAAHWLAQAQPRWAVLVGPAMKDAYEAYRGQGHLHWYPTVQAAADGVNAWWEPVDAVLLKGSRGVGLEALAGVLP